MIPEKADAPPSNAGYSLPEDAPESVEGEIKLVPLGIFKENFPLFFKDYSSKLSFQFKKSFPDDVLKTMSNGYDQ